MAVFRPARSFSISLWWGGVAKNKSSTHRLYTIFLHAFLEEFRLGICINFKLKHTVEMNR